MDGRRCRPLPRTRRRRSGERSTRVTEHDWLDGHLLGKPGTTKGYKDEWE